MRDLYKPPLDDLAHFGVKGMKWGVRNPKRSLGDYRKAVEARSLGSGKIAVISKNGDRLTVERERTPGTAIVVGKMVKRDPEKFVSQMIIRNDSGKKVGEFQVWREGKNNSTVRGEWLDIESSEQGKGYSKAALFGLMEAARRDPKLEEVRLQVPAEAKPAQHIYSGLGFRKDKDLGMGLEDWVYKVPKGGG